jgi:hypothetical protein
MHLTYRASAAEAVSSQRKSFGGLSDHSMRVGAAQDTIAFIASTFSAPWRTLLSFIVAVAVLHHGILGERSHSLIDELLPFLAALACIVNGFIPCARIAREQCFAQRMRLHQVFRALRAAFLPQA